MKSFLQKPLLIFLLLVLLVSCAHRPDIQLTGTDTATPEQNGALISVERIGGYSKLVAQIIVWVAGMSETVPVSNGLDMYRLSYWTSGEDGTPTIATGLLSVPRAERFKAVLSWQHGTAVTRALVPSTPTPDEGVLASIAFAGHGYVLVAADYVGLGGSELPHPYYHAQTAASNIRDLLTAAQSLLRDSNLVWPQSLLMAGFSQGGFNTMVTLRDMETTALPNSTLTAAASIAGPFDLVGFSLPNALKGEAVSTSLYLAYLFNSYSRIYGEPLSEIMNEPYASTLAEIFSGELGGDEVIARLPENPRDLFLAEVLEKYDNGDWGWIGERLQENSLHQWQPDTPLRLFYGSEDIDVSPTEALSQVDRWARAGLEIQAIDVGPFDHNGSVVAAAPLIRNWFDEILADIDSEDATAADTGSR